MAKLITTNIVGSANEQVWAQAQAIVHGENNQTLVVLQLKSEEADSLVNLATIGTEIITEIETRHLGTDLTKSIETVLGESKEGISIQVVVGSIVDNTLSLYGQGEIEVYLAREGKLALLKKNWGSGEILNGRLEEDDRIIIATPELVTEVGMDEFRNVVTVDENPAEVLTPLIRQRENPLGVAAVVGLVQINSELVEENTSPWWERVIKRGPKISTPNENPRKINFWIGLVVFLLLLIMIGVGMVRRVKQIEEATFNTLHTSITAKISETVSVGDLNPDRAKILLTQARSEVEIYLGSEAKDEYKDKARALLLEIETAEEKAFKKSGIELRTVAELSILSEGLSANQMKSDGKGNLVFLDTNTSRLVSMNLSDRSRQVISSAENDDLIDITLTESRVYGLNGAGVEELFWKKDEVKKVIEPDEFWKDPTYIEQFAGNIYVFDREQSEIWKYPVLTDSFGDRRRWLAAGITPDLTKVVDMKVSGDIWLLTETGKLERYSRGAPVTFSMEGFPATGEAKRFASPVAVWATESLIYVLEAGASRVVVFGDDGKYESQYVNSEFNKAQDLVVVDNKAYVLIENVVKEFGL
jgi:hypothetical protein